MRRAVNAINTSKCSSLVLLISYPLAATIRLRIWPDWIHSLSFGAITLRFFASSSTNLLIGRERAPRDNSANTTTLQRITNLRSRISCLKRPNLRLSTYTEVSRIARLAAGKVAWPRFSAVPLDELAMFLGFDHCLQRHFDGLRSSLRSQNSLRPSHKPIIEP